MTALAIASQIPSQIDTLEKLAAWAGLALANINPTVVGIEGQGYQERSAQANIFYIPADNKSRLIVRTSLVIGPDYLAGGMKMWQFVQPLANTAMPTVFTTN